MRVPRSTVTYNTHAEYTFRATTTSSDIMYINNFEQITGDYYVAISGSAVQNFLTNTPVEITDATLHEHAVDG
jgi:hypothetical protein